MKRASEHAPANRAGVEDLPVPWPAERRPAWISDEDLQWVPADAREEVVELIASTYRELVTRAETGLERAAGEELVFIFWLTLLRSLRLRGQTRRWPIDLRIPGEIARWPR